MAYLNNLNPTKIALGDKNFQTLANLEGQYMSQYPGLSTSGGVFSDARHAAATSLMSDRLGGGITGDILANIGGYAREIPSGISELFGLTPQGESLEDLAANLKSFTYPTGTSAANIYSDIFSKYNTQQQRFKQQQLMNRRKQQMQGKIRRAEAFEKDLLKDKAEAAKKKITTTGGPTEIKSYDPSIKKTGPAYGPHKKTKVKVKAKHSPHGGGPGSGGGQKSRGGHKAPGGGGYGPHRGGRNPWGRAGGGLIDVPIPGRSRYI